jgi:hypothetical protein
MSTGVGPRPSGRPVGWQRVLVACVALVSICNAVAGSTSAPVGVTIAENTADRIVIDFRLGSFDQTSVDVDGQKCLLISLPHEAQMLASGAPDLPHVARSVAIPGDAAMAVTVADAKFYDLENVDIAPSKGNLSRSVNPDDVPYTFDKQYYGADAFYPGQLARAGEPYILRDRRGMVVDVYPFQYNPVRRTLRVYTGLTVTVTRVGTGGANVLLKSGFKRGLTVVFGGIYRAQFINLEATLPYTPLEESGDMLIICHDAWLPNVQPLVEYKNSIGIPTTAVGISAVGNNSTAIKNYIQNVFDTSNLTFVLLVGDIAQIASPYVLAGPSDPSYALLAGDDTYPDILIGRFSAETAQQVDTQVQRSIEYEALQSAQQPWFKKATGIASTQGQGIGDNGEIDYVHMNVIRGVLLSHAYTLVDQIYDPNANAAWVTNAVNEGRGLINYCGHGSTTGWTSSNFTTTNVTALVNDNVLPIIFSVACVNGQFDYAYGRCFAEAWMRSTHNGEPTGAAATYMSSINQDWAPPMAAQDAFNVLLADGTAYHSFGALCFAGSCAMMDKYNNSSGANMYKTWHVFGDPSLRVLGTTAPPTGMHVTPTSDVSSTGPKGGPFVPASTTYTLSNVGVAPIDYQVTATQPWVSIDPASGTIPGLSEVIVTVGIGAAGNLLENGLYTDTISIVNTTAHEGDTTRAASLKVGIPSPQFTWDLDTDPGWTVSGEWAFGAPAGRGGPSGYADPIGGATGTNVYGVNLSGNYSTTAGGPYYATLGPVNLSRMSDVSLRFQRWLNSDYYPFVDNTVEVSNNGTSWTKVWSNGGAVMREYAWSAQQYDISSIATNQATVYIRWGYKILGGANAYAGWNIDDVAIWGVKAPPPAIAGDLNCDGNVSYADINPFVLALTGQAEYERVYPDCRWMNADANRDGVVSYADINPFVNCLTSGRCP